VCSKKKLIFSEGLRDELQSEISESELEKKKRFSEIEK
jgi:hypothetical protein